MAGHSVWGGAYASSILVSPTILLHMRVSFAQQDICNLNAYTDDVLGTKELNFQFYYHCGFHCSDEQLQFYLHHIQHTFYRGI